MARPFRLPTAALVCGTATAVLLVAGCGASTQKPGGDASQGGCTPGQAANAPDPAPFTPSVAADAAAAAKVPAAIKTKGTLTVAADASYPPNEFTVSGSDAVTGMDVDLGTAIGKVLGLKVTFVNASFDGILAGIQAGRYDLGMSSFTDSKEREQTVDMVTYFKAGTSTMVQKCNPKKINGDLDLCGKNVGAENGTVQLDALTKPDADGSIVKECTAAGKPKPNGQGFPKQTDVNAALQANRIDAYLADTPVVDYALKKTGDAFQKVGDSTGVAPYGIAVPKSAGTMKDALQAAVQKLIDDGTYKQVLDHWGVTSGSIDKSVVNGAQS